METPCSVAGYIWPSARLLAIYYSSEIVLFISLVGPWKRIYIQLPKNGTFWTTNDWSFFFINTSCQSNIFWTNQTNLQSLFEMLVKVSNHSKRQGQNIVSLWPSFTFYVKRLKFPAVSRHWRHWNTSQIEYCSLLTIFSDWSTYVERLDSKKYNNPRSKSHRDTIRI